MQTKLKPQVLSVLLFLGLFSCTTEETDQQPVEYTGTFSLNIALDNTTEVSFGRTANTTSTDNFLVKILKNDEEVAVFDNYADMAQQEELETGKYSIVVTSGEEQPAAFDNPLYSATQEFTIAYGSNTAIDITCALLNAKVKLTFSDTFKNKYPDASADVYTEEALLNFTENKEGFFSIVENTISPIVRVNYTKEDVDRVKLTQFSELKSNYEVAVIVNYNQENDVVFFGEEYTPMTEKEVLMEIKESIHPNSTYLYNWGDDVPFNEWYGINVNEDGFVDSLKLHIIKPLPTSIENLTHLKTLEINHRKAGGGLPDDKTLPIEYFSSSQLTSLKTFGGKFDWNNILMFNKLEHLVFTGFSTTPIGNELSEFKNLKTLWISVSDVYGVIGEPFHQSFNDELKKLTQIEELIIKDLNYNLLTIPENIGDFTKLKILKLKSDGITGDLPNEIYQLTNLEELVIEGQFTGEISSSIYNLTNLTSLHLYGNLTGSIPNAIANLDKLIWLSLAGNNLTGNIISEFGLMENLYVLYLNDNQFTGEIPKELGALPELTHVDFSNNQLSGSIPEEIEQISTLYSLYLSHNQLSGTIPEFFATMRNLRSLHLDNNNFEGTISQDIIDRLRTFDLTYDDKNAPE
ncbi:DUF4493 domain-containing protein [Flammeovirga pectinis]|uniref:DUF4493 domain-containing protein n=1 Tax=Flammeovirga pectinis TaxID=2494373 RepID=A0A3S9PAC8_9BACT|nr:DUF4493 domain-containing protein [Flammeovirga pectinis]AZQ65166.1 DUF4493 domain-containing protein [Flammeovirga pectinis]